MTTDEAEMVLEVLDAQRRYFESRLPEDLTRSKPLERRLREYAEAALDPPPPGLFGVEHGDPVG